MLKHYADIVLKKEEFSENEFIFLNDVIKKVTLNHMDDYKKIADKNVMSIAGSAYTPPEALNYLNDKHFNNSFANVARAQAELNLKLREMKYLYALMQCAGDGTFSPSTEYIKSVTGLDKAAQSKARAELKDMGIIEHEDKHYIKIRYDKLYELSKAYDTD